MANILACDPGTTASAWLVYDGCVPLAFGIEPNKDLLPRISGMGLGGDVLVIEQIESQGMAVGAETFETVFWSGRFAQAWAGDWDRVTRRAVKLHLCGNMRAKDKNVRQALIDSFGGSASIKKGGPLYKVASHCWSALAVAVTYWDTTRKAAA